MGVAHPLGTPSKASNALTFVFVRIAVEFASGHFPFTVIAFVLRLDPSRLPGIAI